MGPTVGVTFFTNYIEIGRPRERYSEDGEVSHNSGLLSSAYKRNRLITERWFTFTSKKDVRLVSAQLNSRHFVGRERSLKVVPLNIYSRGDSAILSQVSLMQARIAFMRNYSRSRTLAIVPYFAFRAFPGER